MKRTLLGLLLSAGLACSATSTDSEVASVERDALAMEVDITGSLKAIDADSLGPPGVAGVWDYKIAMLAPEGAEVEKGEPVLGFDATNLQRRLEEKTAQRDTAIKQLEMTQSAAKVSNHDLGLELAEAKAELRKAKLKADAPEDIVASVELKKLRLDLELAEKKVTFIKRKRSSTKASHEAQIARWVSERDRAQQRVEQLTTAVEKMTVLAPRDGTVIYEPSWNGEKKKVGDSAWRAETVVQVVSLTEMEAWGDVDEVDSAKIAVGQTVSLRLDALADVELAGTVKTISATVQRQSPDNPLKVAKVKLELDAEHGQRLRPGMRFRGRVETERIEDLLVAPIGAFVATPDGPVALVKRGAQVERTPVTLGRRNANFVEVETGLNEGDEILRADQGRKKP